MKERLGLPKRAHSRHLTRVMQKGKLYSREGWKKFKVFYNGFLYVFALESKLKPILITAYNIE